MKNQQGLIQRKRLLESSPQNLNTAQQTDQLQNTHSYCFSKGEGSGKRSDINS
mgnify:CR=1 FL=1